MNNSMTVSGAYGRDYTKVQDAKNDWENGKDFVLRGIGEGRYCSIRDFGVSQTVTLRYNKDLRVTMVKGSASDINPSYDCDGAY